jgi:hypothetical protein
MSETWELFALTPSLENSIPKIGFHYFWAGLIALLKNTLTYSGVN